MSGLGARAANVFGDFRRWIGGVPANGNTFSAPQLFPVDVSPEPKLTIYQQACHDIYEAVKRGSGSYMRHDVVVVVKRINPEVDSGFPFSQDIYCIKVSDDRDSHTLCPAFNFCDDAIDPVAFVESAKLDIDLAGEDVVEISVELCNAIALHQKLGRVCGQGIKAGSCHYQL